MATSNVIHTAINNGHFHQVRFLVDKGADVNERDGSGRTPLILCALITDKKWSVGLARLLLENGARISKCDTQGFNALHHACVNQRSELVDVYLKALDCDIHSRCKNGNTSLHYAASLGNRAIVKTLAELVLKYKLSLDPINKKGLTPLHQAFKANQLDCGDLLMEYGADQSIPDSDRKTAAQLRQDAVQRLTILAQRHERRRPSAKLIRKITQEAEAEKPKAESEIITIARDYDLRNDPEYVFNTSAVTYFHKKEAKRIRRCGFSNNAIEGKPKLEMWKEEIMSLWNQYEAKISDSYRAPAKYVPPVPEQVDPRFSIVSTTATIPVISRRSSRVGITKSTRTGSMTQEGTSSRRPSIPSRRNGMPPLVKTQTRSYIGLT